MKSKYMVPNDGEHPNGCLATFISIATVVIGFTIAVAVISFTGCKSLPDIPTETNHSRDSISKEYVHDSIYIDRWHTQYQRGDTIFSRDSIYIDRWHRKHDSIYVAITDTITNNVEVKYVPPYYQNTSRGFWVLLAILAVIIGWKVVRWIIKVKTGGLI